MSRLRRRTMLRAPVLNGPSTSTREPAMKLAQPLASLALLMGLGQTCYAINVDVTTGTTGSTMANQSFNETRGVTGRVLGGGALELLSMELRRFDINNAPGRPL